MRDYLPHGLQRTHHQVGEGEELDKEEVRRGEGERGGEREGRRHCEAQLLGTRRDMVEKQLAPEKQEVGQGSTHRHHNQKAIEGYVNLDSGTNLNISQGQHVTYNLYTSSFCKKKHFPQKHHVSRGT